MLVRGLESPRVCTGSRGFGECRVKISEVSGSAMQMPFRLGRLVRIDSFRPEVALLQLEGHYRQTFCHKTFVP